MQRVNMGVIQTFARKEIKFLLTEQQYQDFLPLLNHYMNRTNFALAGKSTVSTIFTMTHRMIFDSGIPGKAGL